MIQINLTEYQHWHTWRMITQLLPPLPHPRPSGLLKLPAKAIPAKFHSRSLAMVLNRILVDALLQGELDFLEGRILQIEIEDLGLDYRLTLLKQRLAPGVTHRDPDVRFGGHLKEFMLLALQKEDPDTLFFQRRLQLEGDTELGLEIKNFLYTLDQDVLPAPLRQIGEQMVKLL